MTITIALDWTPNTNHTGLFVARELGYYAAQELDVTLLSPATDNYATTPAKKLELGLVDFAVAPFESVISLRTKARPVAAVAVAALLQRDISSIATLATSAITRPKDLDGRTYASYRARYEDAIVKQLIINDGGTGDLTLTYPEKLGIWNTLLTGEADATWIFDNWEGIEAQNSQLKLTKFALTDYGIPYAYSPVLLSTQEKIDQHATAYRAFLQATKQGYEFAAAHPQQAARMLAGHVPTREAQAINIVQSQEFVSPFYGVGASWGLLEASRVASFLHWLVDHQLEDASILTLDLYTNDLLR
jgi:ABC-type nitrate/sulfonate/bicarbonate transport system substrate-binding protein